MLCGLGMQQSLSQIRYIHVLPSGYATMRNAQWNNSEDNLFLIRCIYFVTLSVYNVQSWFVLVCSKRTVQSELHHIAWVFARTLSTMSYNKTSTHSLNVL